MLNVAKGSEEPGASPSVGQLAAASGLPAAPTAPVQAASIGGTADQAKMAGTPASLKGQSNALQTAVRGKKDLTTALREQQVSSVKSEAEQAAQAAGQQLAGFGSLSTAVPGLIQKAYANVAAQAEGTGLVADPSKMPPGVNADAWNAAMQTVGSTASSGQQVADALVTINQMSGKTADTAMTADQVKQFFLQPAPSDATEAAVAAVQAGATPASVTLGQLHPQDLGASSWDQLGSELGISADAVQKMSVADLGSALKAIQTKGYNTEAQWRSVLSDPTTSLQERSTARMILNGMGAQGVTESEASVAKLTTQVQAANTVTVNGTQMTVGDALSSDVVKGLVANILQDPQGAAALQNPGLTSWALQHQAELGTVLAKIDPAVQDLAKVHTENLSTFSKFPDSAGMATTFGFDPTQVTDQAWPVPQGFKDVTANLNADQSGAMTNVISAMQDAGVFNPQAFMAAADHLGPSGMLDASSPAYQDMMAGLKQEKATNDLAKDANATPDQVLSGLAGIHEAEVPVDSDTLRIGSALSVAIPGAFENGITAKSVSAAAAALPHYNPLTAAAPPPNLAATLKTALSATQAAAMAAGPAASALYTAVQSGKPLTPDTFTSIAATLPTAGGDLSALDKLDTLAQSTSGPQAANAVSAAINGAITGIVNHLVTGASTYGSIGAMKAAMLNPATVKDDKVHGQMDQSILAMMASPEYKADPRTAAQVNSLYNTWQSTKNSMAQAVGQLGGGVPSISVGNPNAGGGGGNKAGANEPGSAGPQLGGPAFDAFNAAQPGPVNNTLQGLVSKYTPKVANPSPKIKGF